MTTLTSRSLCWTLTTAAIVVCFAGNTHGFTVQTTHTYGKFEGASVTYLNVRESTATESPIANDGTSDSLTARMVTEVRDPTVLYGSPTITGNVLSFEDPNFSSLAGTQTIGPADVTDGRLSFSLQTDPSMYIQYLTLDEFGLVSLTSTSATANAGTLARIQAPAFLTVNEVALDDGTTFALPIATRLVTELVVTPTETVTNGGWDADSPPMVKTKDENGNDIYVPTSAWQGRVTFDIVDMLAANGITAPDRRTIVGATSVDYDMNNTLTTIAQVGDSTAFIDKKGISIYPDLVPMQVPEPFAGVMMLMAFVGIGLKLRRSRN